MANMMTYDEILRDLKNGNFKPVYVLMGAEPFYIDQLQDAILQNVLPEEDRDFCLNIFYGAETTANAVINAARSFPMGERLLIIVRNANELRNIEELAFYLKNPQPTTILVLVNKVGSFDGRKKFMTLAGEIGAVYDSPKVRENQLPPLISAYFKKRGCSIDNKSVSLIAESVGPDLTRLYGEMNKLVNALGEGECQVSPDVVEKHIGISKDFNIFEFQNALIMKDSLKAFLVAKYFDKNPKQNPIQQVLPSLFRLFSQLMVAYYAPAKDARTLANYLGMQDWQVQRNILPALRNYSASKVLNILQAIRDADEKSKGMGGANISNGDLLKQLIFFILH